MPPRPSHLRRACTCMEMPKADKVKIFAQLFYEHLIQRISSVITKKKDYDFFFNFLKCKVPLFQRQTDKRSNFWNVSKSILCNAMFWKCQDNVHEKSLLKKLPSIIRDHFTELNHTVYVSLETIFWSKSFRHGSKSKIQFNLAFCAKKSSLRSFARSKKFFT